MRLTATVLATMALLSTVAQAKDPLVLEPNSPWLLNYDLDSCVITRQFGEEGQQAILEMRAFEPHGLVRYSVLSQDLQSIGRDIEVQHGPALPEPVTLSHQSTSLLQSGDYRGRMFYLGSLAMPGHLSFSDPGLLRTYKTFVAGDAQLSDEDRTLLLSVWDLDRDSPDFGERSDIQENREAYNNVFSRFRESTEFLVFRENFERTTEYLSVDGAFATPIMLRTGAVDQIMAGMRGCIDELVTHWGIDVEAHKTLSRQVRLVNIEQVFRSVSRAHPGGSAELRIRLDVSAEGRATECHFPAEIADNEFKRAACRSLKDRAIFDPALDKDGIPIASYHAMRFLFR